ncbi:hypothetical protein Tco_1222015 [Tanacetum coccineum]
MLPEVGNLYVYPHYMSTNATGMLVFRLTIIENHVHDILEKQDSKSLTKGDLKSAQNGEKRENGEIENDKSLEYL